MAKSAFGRVKEYELNDEILPNTWIVVRIDGENFRKFSDTHHFLKPNDKRCLDLMNKAASVVWDIGDIIMAYGQNDKYSFIFDRTTKLHNRSSSKILTHVCSLFTSSFVFFWKEFFPDVSMIYPPSFVGKVVIYATNKGITGYLRDWQKVCHTNNLYNTTFWALVQQGGLTPQEAEAKIRETDEAEKNEILFSEFGINYNKESEQFRKGTFILREKPNGKQVIIENSALPDNGIYILHIAISGNKLWKDNPHILGEE